MRQLECFVRVCELGSISRAAEQLNIAQPALGLQIKNLEHEFGATLFMRSSRGVAPTPAGEVLLEWARDVIERTRQVKARLRASARTEDVVLRLGLTPSITMLLAGAILEEARTISGLTLQIAEGLSHLVVGWVETDTVDLALVSGNVESRLLTQTPLMREPLYHVTRGPAATAQPIRLSEALAGPLAMPGENDALRRIVETEARQLELPLTVTYEIASIPAIKELVLRGVAAAILPYGLIAREIRNGELAARAIVEPSLFRTLTLVRPAGRPVGSHERDLVAVLRRCLASIEPEGSGALGFELFKAPLEGRP